jgi:hypothetical protein
MISFDELFFCEKVILNRDGSPREFINRFKTIFADNFPYLFGFSIVSNIIFSQPFRHVLTIRIRGREDEVIFEGARQHIQGNTLPHFNSKLQLISTLENVEFPNSGDYTLYSLFDDIVVHHDILSLTMKMEMT